MELQESPQSTPESPRFQVVQPCIQQEFSVEQLNTEIYQLQVKLAEKLVLKAMIDTNQLGDIVAPVVATNVEVIPDSPILQPSTVIPPDDPNI